MLRVLSLLVPTIILQFVPLWGTMVECGSLREVLQHVDQETLVVLDVDNTLMRPAQMLGSEEWREHLAQAAFVNHQDDPQKALRKLLLTWHKALLASQFVPVEPYTAGVVRQLQRRGNHVIGLTSRYLEVAYLTEQQLLSMDIDLSRLSPYPFDIEVPGGSRAKLVQGILFAGLDNDKGEILFQLLDAIDYQPTAILFVDDQLKHVRSVERVAKLRSTPFVGIRYSACDHLAGEFDPYIAQKQWDTLSNGLTDEEAEQLLQYEWPEL